MVLENQETVEKVYMDSGTNPAIERVYTKHIKQICGWAVFWKNFFSFHFSGIEGTCTQEEDVSRLSHLTKFIVQ